MFRVALPLPLLAILIAPIFGATQESSSPASAAPLEAAQAVPQTPSVPEQLTSAEAAIANS